MIWLKIATIQISKQKPFILFFSRLFSPLNLHLSNRLSPPSSRHYSMVNKEQAMVVKLAGQKCLISNTWWINGNNSLQTLFMLSFQFTESDKETEFLTKVNSYFLYLLYFFYVA